MRRVIWGSDVGAGSGAAAVQKKMDQVWLYMSRVQASDAVKLNDSEVNHIFLRRSAVDEPYMIYLWFNHIARRLKPLI